MNVLGEFARARDIEVLGRRRRRDVAVVLDGRPARRAGLARFDEDHAVRRAAAVDRGRGSVLQDGDRRNVRRVQEIQGVARQRW